MKKNLSIKVIVMVCSLLCIFYSQYSFAGPDVRYRIKGESVTLSLPEYRDRIYPRGSDDYISKKLSELKALVNLFKSSETTMVSTYGIYLGPLAVKAIRNAIGRNETIAIEHLEFTSTAMREESFEWLIDGLRANKVLLKGLKVLSLANSEIGVKGMQALGRLLEDPDCVLEDLDIHNCGIDDIGVEVIANSLRKNPNAKLAKLNMMNNKVSDDGCKHLADVIRYNNTLISFDISGNYSITNTGYRSLNDALISNDTRQSFDYTSDLGSEEARYLAQNLSKNNHLKELSIIFSFSRSDLNREGVESLAKALVEHPTLNKAELLPGYLFSRDRRARWKEVTKWLESSKLKTFYMEGDFAGVTGEDFEKLFAVNKCLSDLRFGYYSSSKLDEEDIKAVTRSEWYKIIGAFARNVRLSGESGFRFCDDPAFYKMMHLVQDRQCRLENFVFYSRGICSTISTQIYSGKVSKDELKPLLSVSPPPETIVKFDLNEIVRWCRRDGVVMKNLDEAIAANNEFIRELEAAGCSDEAKKIKNGLIKRYDNWRNYNLL